MFFEFQKHISTSQATLPVVSVAALVAWFMLPSNPVPAAFSGEAYGLWEHVPLFLQMGWWSQAASAVCVAVAVYLMIELNNANVLLRVSSRMLSCILLLLLVFVPTHSFQPGCVVMLLVLLSFFPLMASFQYPHPVLAFETFLLLSLASLVFPKLFWMVPLYWGLQGYLRAFSFKCFVASLLALLLPYWFFAGIAFVMGAFSDFLEHVQVVADVRLGAVRWDTAQIVTLGFVVLLFATGAVDFFINRLKDKTRTRVVYNMLIIHGLYVIVLLFLQSQLFWTLLLLLLIDTAILFGHFFSLTHTKFSHVYCLVLLVIAAAIMTFQYIPGLFDTLHLIELFRWIH